MPRRQVSDRQIIDAIAGTLARWPATALPYQSQPLADLQKRVREAMKRRYSVEKLKRAEIDPPDNNPAQIFDFQDGRRLVLSRETQLIGLVGPNKKITREHVDYVHVSVQHSLPHMSTRDTAKWKQLLREADLKTNAGIYIQAMRKDALIHFQLLVQKHLQPLEWHFVPQMSVLHMMLAAATVIEALDGVHVSDSTA